MRAAFIPRYNFNDPPPGFEFIDVQRTRVSAPGVEASMDLPTAWAYFQSHTIPPGMHPHPWAGTSDGGFDHALVFDTALTGRATIADTSSVPYTINTSADDARGNAWTWYARRAELSRRRSDAIWPTVLLWSEEEVAFAWTAPADIVAAEHLAREADHRRMPALAQVGYWGAGLRHLLEQRLKQLTTDLEGWTEGTGRLVPTEPDATARALVRLQLRTAVAELSCILGLKVDGDALEATNHRDAQRIADDARESDAASSGSWSIARRDAEILDLERWHGVLLADLRTLAKAHGWPEEQVVAVVGTPEFDVWVERVHQLMPATHIDEVVAWLCDEVNTDEARAIASDLKGIADHLADVGLYTRPLNSETFADLRRRLLHMHEELCTIVGCKAEFLNEPGADDRLLAAVRLHIDGLNGAWRNLDATRQQLEARCAELVGYLNSPTPRMEKTSIALNPAMHGIIIDVPRSMHLTDDARIVGPHDPVEHRLHAAANTWARILGVEVLDYIEGGRGRYAVLGSVNGLRVEVQLVDDETPGVHLDIAASNVDDVCEQLVAMQSTRLRSSWSPDAGSWIVMRAPTGHVFCVVPREDRDVAHDAFVARREPVNLDLVVPAARLGSKASTLLIKGEGQRLEHGQPLHVVVVLEDHPWTDGRNITTAIGCKRTALHYGPIDVSELMTGIRIANEAGVEVLVVSCPVVQSEKARFRKDPGIATLAYDVLIVDREVVRSRYGGCDPEIAEVLARPLQETQESVTRWAYETFGECGPLRAAVRAAEEMEEFISVLMEELGACGENGELWREVSAGRGGQINDDVRKRLLKETGDIITALWRFCGATSADGITGYPADAQAVVNEVMAINRARLWLPDGTGCGYHVTVLDEGMAVRVRCKALGLDTRVDPGEDAGQRGLAVLKRMHEQEKRLEKHGVESDAVTIGPTCRACGTPEGRPHFTQCPNYEGSK